MTDSKEYQKFGLTEKKENNFSEWYQQLVLKSDFLDYYEVSGCYIIRPSCMYIWNCIRKMFTSEIEKMGVDECYFPMLVRKHAMEREKDHIENFEPELAWITRCGENDIEPVALRPTSESIMYPNFAKWLRSYRDLPLKFNQWCNVVRWEVKSTTPLIRGREFLWQEGHTVHLKLSDAEKEVEQILDLYEKVYKDLLAVPVIKGKKTENEKFGGAKYTLTVEAFIPANGRAVQAATSHCLGDNFSKMFNIKVADVDESEIFVTQNSWGITTRSIGIAIMIHSDNKGLVLPPKVSMIQVIIIPCGIPNIDKFTEVMKYIYELMEELKNSGIRVKLDDRDHVSPGYKFNHWEIRGVPIRLEVGPRDFSKNEVRLVTRYNNEKIQIPRNNISQKIMNKINEIHDNLYENALKIRNNSIKKVTSWVNFMKELNKKNMILAPWCMNSDCEKQIRKRSGIVTKKEVLMGAKSLCIPFEQNELSDLNCVNCENKAKIYCLFGRSY